MTMTIQIIPSASLVGTHRPTTMDHHPGVVDRNSGVPNNLLINGKGQFTYYPVYFGYMLRGKILTDFLNPHAAEARERDNSLANIKESVKFYIHLYTTSFA
ncbi:unnamed protein product [Timema podura]|uniref:Uncharacterized protein n=1 Tax=Timema podura TaxID=61482 RepID=A0ABN7NR07_TIMPD|nr:unnamed protein product [Timema podura]